MKNVYNNLEGIYFQFVKKKNSIFKVLGVKITIENSEKLDFYFDKILMVEFQVEKNYSQILKG